MTAETKFQTYFEDGLILEQLAKSTGCSLVQFLGDSVLSIMLCLRIAEENRLDGKVTPTQLLIEHQNGQGYGTYDFMESLRSSVIPYPCIEDNFPVPDPFTESPTLTLTLPDGALSELKSLSELTEVSPRKLLEEGINLRWLLKQADDKGLEVLLEGAGEDEYIPVPTSFVD